MNNDKGLKDKDSFGVKFGRFSNQVTKATGSPTAFLVAFLVIVVWGVTGPMFHYSDTWQLVINTSTTIITFLMVFLIQQSQNKDTMALQLKLNELIASNRNASNRLIDIEDLSEIELKMLKKFYVTLAGMAAEDTNVFASHSIDEAKIIHKEKLTDKKNRNKKIDKPTQL